VDEKVKREELERGVAYLKGQVAALQDRIEALEQRLHA
jgi:FtsZ-binding cell division protein ZapB